MHPLFLATEKFQSPSNIPPPSNGDRNFLITKRDRAYAIILQKNQKSSPTFLLGQLKKFGCHPMVWVCQMATEIL
jgi:hypothetical protein